MNNIRRFAKGHTALVAAMAAASLLVGTTAISAAAVAAPKQTAAVHIVTARQIINQPTPKIVGKIQVGSKLRVEVGKWDKGVTLSYQWKRWTKNIPGATGTSYVPVPNDQGTSMSVTVTARKSGYQTVQKTSNASVAVEPRP